jgi:hypothetical protein
MVTGLRDSIERIAMAPLVAKGAAMVRRVSSYPLEGIFPISGGDGAMGDTIGFVRVDDVLALG